MTGPIMIPKPEFLQKSDMEYEDNFGSVRFTRKKALPIEDAVGIYIREMRIASGLNTRCIFSAWDKCSEAGKYTTRRYFRDGKLYITLSSSVVRDRLRYRSEEMILRMNKALEEDELFTKDDPRVGFVKELILK